MHRILRAYLGSGVMRSIAIVLFAEYRSYCDVSEAKDEPRQMDACKSECYPLFPY
jgi:hypothetical protein